MKEDFRRHLGMPAAARKQQALWCRSYWPEDCRRILKTADELCHNIFLFQLPWDMEQTQVPVEFTDDIQWDYVPDGDEEFVFQMNRHRCFICLGQAYALTGHEKYVQCFVRQFLDWIEKEPCRSGAANTTWRTLEAGLRITCWLRAMAFFVDSPYKNETVWRTFFEAVRVHAEYLYTNKKAAFSKKSNWGVMENGGLYAAGLVLHEPRYTQQAVYFLKEALNIQIMDDGMQWEQSFMYHNEVLMSFLEVLRIAGLYQEQPFTGDECETIRAMAEVTRISQNPNGCQPMMGDSDDTSVRDLLTQAAWQFKDGTLKCGGYQVLDFESIWLYPPDDFYCYEKLPENKAQELLSVLKFSGQVFFRSDWSETADWLHFINGPMGGGHGHFDKLHLDLFLDGEEVLIDPGRFTYKEVPLRFQLKAARSHNVPMVDREEYGQSTGSWSVSALPAAFGNTVCRKGEFLFLEGAHFGYEEKGVLLKRRILCLGQGIYIIADEFLGKRGKLASQFYHFSETISLQLSGDECYGSGRQTNFIMKSFAGNQAVAMELEKCFAARHYNQPGETMQLEVYGKNARTITTFLIKQQPEKPVTVVRRPVYAAAYDKYLDYSEGEGFVLHNGSDRYAVILLYQDPGNQEDYVGIEGVFGLGRVMAARLDGQFGSQLDGPAKGMTVMQW